MFRTLSLQALRLVSAIVGSFGALGICFAATVSRPYGMDAAVAVFGGSLFATVVGCIVAAVCTHKLES